MDTRVKAAVSSSARPAIPYFFRPVLWSYDLARFDAEKNKELLIVQTINYGDLPHWRWIIARYGRDAVRAILQKIPATVLRPRVQRLVAHIFDVQAFNHAPRRA